MPVIARLDPVPFADRPRFHAVRAPSARTTVRLATVATALSLALLSACARERDVQQALARALPAETDRFARTYLDEVRRGDLTRAVAALSPMIHDTAMARDSLAAAARFLPGAPLDTVRVVGAQWLLADGVRRQEVTYEVHGSTGWALVSVVVAEEMGLRYVEGFRVQSLAAPIAEPNAFTLRGKGAGHVLMLVLTAVCFLTTLAGAVVAARTPMPRRWLWAVGALVGFGRFTFNWTTGQVEQAMAWVQLFAVGVFRPGLAGPWLISVSCPALAVVALERARRFRQATERATASAIANVEGSPSDPPSGDQTRTGLAMGDHPPQRSSVEPAADLSADTPGTVSPS